MAIFLDVTNNEKQFEVEISTEAITFGRSSKCSYAIDDEKVSGKHLAIKLDKEGQVIFKDLGSSNGSFLNKEVATKGHLYVHDILQIGKYKIRLLHEKMSDEQIKFHAKKLTAEEKSTARKLAMQEKAEKLKNKKGTIPMAGVDQVITAEVSGMTEELVADQKALLEEAAKSKKQFNVKKRQRKKAVEEKGFFQKIMDKIKG